MNSIQALQSDGFQLGNAATYTSNGDNALYTYYYAAFSGASDTRNSSGIFHDGRPAPIDETEATISPSTTSRFPAGSRYREERRHRRVFRTSSMGGDNTAYLDSGTADFTGGIVSLDSKGFTIGTIRGSLNTNSTNYYWTAYGNAWSPKNNSERPILP